MFAEQSIQHFSTQAVPERMRFDYWMSVLQQSLWPVSEWSRMQDLAVNLEEAKLGSLTSMMEEISAHQSRRTRCDVENSRDQCYLLFSNRRPWLVAHRGQSERIEGGECILVDSQGELETSAPGGFKGVILKLPVDWARTWLPDPESILGRRIAANSKWGQVLSPIVAQMTPELAVSPPLPHSVMVDQLGAVLALIAGDQEVRQVPDLLAKIKECIHQRFAEPQLTAADIALSLNISPRIMHQTLAASSTTFAMQLLDARVNRALQMLSTPSFNRVTTAEIARQTGFLSTSHFARVVRKRTGHAPQELRRLMH